MIRKRTLNLIIQRIGGFLIVLYVPLFLGLIWYDDTKFMWKLIGTNTVLIVMIYFADELTQYDAED